MNNDTTALQTSSLPHPALRAFWTVLPIAYYVWALQIELPTHHAGLNFASFNSIDSHTLMTVGLYPWFFAAIVVRLLGLASHWDQNSPMSRVKFYRITNVMGLVLAVLFSSVIVLIWEVPPHLGIYDPSVVESRKAQFIPLSSSPYFIFFAILISAIVFKMVVDVALPRSFFPQNGSRVLAIVSVLPIVSSVITFGFNVFLGNLGDIGGLVITLLQCSLMIVFLFLNPVFFTKDLKTKDLKTKDLKTKDLKTKDCASVP